MNHITIESGHGFTIKSHGNGWAYTITREDDGAEVWLQDSDATLFRAEYDDLMRDHDTANTRASRFTRGALLDTMLGDYFAE